ncbi:hypothetical protein MMC27_002428 [Xylographa pallens]|nr:hypothetical protein [Xylographa pallens]
MSTFKNPSVYIQDITKWLQSAGGFIHPAVEIVHSHGATGYSLRVRKDHNVLEGSRIASCPSSLTMSVLSMERTENLWPNEFVSFFSQSPEVLTRFFLMEQCLIAEDSFWHPYIRMLPQPEDDALDTPMFYSPEDCVWIKGTNLEGTRKVRLEQWKQEYQKAVDLLGSSDVTRYELLRENWRELYLWAATILTSRCFSSDAFAMDNTEPKSNPNAGPQDQRPPLTSPSSAVFPVLLPVLDFGNHDPSAGVYWKMQGLSYSFIVNETLESGKEICISYDNKGNEELIMGYGFSLDNNPKDAFRLLLRSTATSRSLTKARSMQQQLQQQQTQPLHNPSTQHAPDEPPISKQTSSEAFPAPPPSRNPDMFLLYPIEDAPSFFTTNQPLVDTFSILAANARELRTLTITPTRSFIPSPPTPPTHNRLVLSTLLLSELLHKQRAITTHTPLLPPAPTNTRQVHAARYHRSQLHILASNIAALRAILRSAAHTPTTRLLRLEDLLTKDDILAPDAPVQPPPRRPNPLRAAVHHILGTRSSRRIHASGHADLVFTLWLCGAWLQRRDEPTGFPALLGRWLGCLATAYGRPPLGEARAPAGDEGDEGDDDDDDDDEDREDAIIAASYLVVVQAVAETGPRGEGYADGRWGAGLLEWGVRVVRGEGVLLPGEGDGEGEKFVLFVGEW